MGHEIRGAKGFTLVELVVVIVILGVLAATAAPKFLDLKRDARIATLQGFKAAAKSANTMVYAKAVLKGVEAYDETNKTGDASKYNGACNGGANNCVLVGGIWVRTKNRYIDRNDIARIIDSDMNQAGMQTNRGVGGYQVSDSYNVFCTKMNSAETCDRNFCQCVFDEGPFNAKSKKRCQAIIPNGVPYSAISALDSKTPKCFFAYCSVDSYNNGQPGYFLKTDGC